MSQNDFEYFRERAISERKNARAAANREIAAIHDELAREYDTLADSLEVSRTLEAVG